MNVIHATVTSKGQLVIPARIRRRLGIRKGTRVAVHEEGSRLIVQPLTDEFLRKLQGWLKPAKGKRSMMDTLLAERHRKKAR